MANYPGIAEVFGLEDALEGKAGFIRLESNPINGVPSSYELSGTITNNSGDLITLPLTYSYASENLWGGDGQVLQVVGNFWRLSVGDAIWNSDQDISTLPENCTWVSTGVNTGYPILTPSTELIRTTGQFALVNNGVNAPTMWENLGNDETPNWVESPTLPIEQSDVSGLTDTLEGLAESIGVTQLALLDKADSAAVASTLSLKANQIDLEQAEGISPTAWREVLGVIDLASLLASPRSYPSTPNTIWIDSGHVAISDAWALVSGNWTDSGRWYDSQIWTG